MKNRDLKLTVTCWNCQAIYIVTVNSDDWKDWKAGNFIQNAMPYLSVNEREILISGICGNCFTQIWGETHTKKIINSIV